MRLAAIALVISTVASGCGESRISQCNKLINIANKSKSINVAKDPAVLNQVSDSLDRIKTELQAVKLGDEKLKAFQARFISMYDETSKAIREASKSKDRVTFEQASKNLQAVANKEAPLVNEVNKYCSGS